MNIAATDLPSSVTMWEPATKPDELTVLRRADGQEPVAGKIVRRDVAGEIKVKDTGGGAVFHVGRASFATFDDMLESVRSLASDPLSFTISGAPKIGLLNADGSAKNLVRRKTTFRDARRSVAVFDLDKIPTYRDETDDPQTACEMLVAKLPKPLRGTRAVVCLSSTCGLDGCPHWRAQAYMLLDKPLSPDRLKAATNGMDAEVREAHGYTYYPADHWIDPKVHECVQPRFVGAPLFEGVADPHPQRVFVVDGSRERVRTGDLPKEPAAKRGRPKGSGKASASKGQTPKRKADTHAPHPSVPSYHPSEAELPDDTALFTPAEPDRSLTRFRYFHLALDIQRVALMRPWHGQAARGWRDDFVFRATDCVCIAEGLPTGQRAREIGEEIRKRIAPDMPSREMERYLTSLASRCEQDIKTARKLRREWLRSNESRKYHYSSGRLCRDLDISEAEQERMAALYSRRVADRRRYYGLRGPSRVVASTTEVNIPTGKETDMVGFDDFDAKTSRPERKSEPTPKHKASSLSAMKSGAWLADTNADVPADTDAESVTPIRAEEHTASQTASPEPTPTLAPKEPRAAPPWLPPTAPWDEITERERNCREQIERETEELGEHPFFYYVRLAEAEMERADKDPHINPATKAWRGRPPMKGDRASQAAFL